MRLADIKPEVEGALKSVLGNQINLLPTSVFSQVVGVFADREATLWELAQDTYDSQYPATASGASLENVVSMNNIKRLAATYSQVETQLLFGTVGTVIPGGTQFSVNGNPDATFLTVGPATLGAGVNEVQSIIFAGTPAAGNWTINFGGQSTTALAYNAVAATVQTAINALSNLSGVTVSGNYGSGFTITYAGPDGAQNQPLMTVTHNLTVAGGAAVVVATAEATAGVPQATVLVQASATGPVLAPAGLLTNIDTPITGLTATLNQLDAVAGRDLETDEQLRARRVSLLQVAGSGTVEAIRSRLLTIQGVTNVVVFENTSDITDGGGRPPHSSEAVVYGGTDSDIAKILWATKPAGIPTFGNVTSSIIDSQGVTRPIFYSRPTSLLIYASLDLTTDSTFPSNGAVVAEQTLVNWGNALGIGKNVVVYPQLVAALNAIPGITDMTIRIGTSAVSNTLGAAAQDNNIVVAANQISAWDTGRVTINVQ